MYLSQHSNKSLDVVVVSTDQWLAYQLYDAQFANPVLSKLCWNLVAVKVSHNSVLLIPELHVSRVRISPCDLHCGIACNHNSFSGTSSGTPNGSPA